MRVHTSELSEFSPAERWSLVRDGHAVVIDGIICTIDTLPGPGLRLDAHLCAGDIDTGDIDGHQKDADHKEADHKEADHKEAVAIEQSALWVLGAVSVAPRQPSIAGLDGVRLYVGRASVNVRELNIPRTDCLSFGNRLVTTPERTAADIARYSEDDDTALADLTALAERTGYHGRHALAILGRTVHLPFARRARTRLGAALAHAVGVIDAVDPADGIEESLKVAGVAHFKNEPVKGKSLSGRGHRGRKNVDVIFGQDARDV